MTQSCKLQPANTDASASEMPKPDRHGRYSADSGVRIVSPRQRRDDPLLIALQQASVVVQIASRIGGPQGIRSSLGERRSLPELPDGQIEVALVHVEAVQAISDEKARRVVALLSLMNDNRPVHTHRSAAKAMGEHLSLISRLKVRGLAEVAQYLQRVLSS